MTTEWQRKNKERVNQYNREYRAKRKALGIPMSHGNGIKTSDGGKFWTASCRECVFGARIGSKYSNHQKIRFAVYSHVRTTGHKVEIVFTKRTYYEKVDYKKD